MEKTDKLSCLLFRQMSWKNGRQENNSKSCLFCENPSCDPEFLAATKLKRAWEQVGSDEDSGRRWALWMDAGQCAIRAFMPSMLWTQGSPRLGSGVWSRFIRSLRNSADICAIHIRHPPQDVCPCVVSLMRAILSPH